MNRLKNLTNNHYVNVFKSGVSALFSYSCSYNQVLQKVGSGLSPTYSLNLWARYNHDNFDQIEVICVGESTTGKQTAISNVSFTLGFVEIDNTWTSTNVITKPGILDVDNSFKQSFTLADIASVFEIDGEKTIYVDAKATRLGRQLKRRFYFNDIGLYESFLKLKNKVNFLDLTKLDE